MNFWTPKKIKAVNETLQALCQQMKDEHGIELYLGDITFTGCDGSNRGNIAKLTKSSNPWSVQSAAVLRPIVNYEYDKDEVDAYNRMINSVAFHDEFKRTGIEYTDMKAFSLGDSIELDWYKIVNTTSYWDRYNLLSVAKSAIYGFNPPKGCKIYAKLVGFNKKKTNSPMIFELICNDDYGKNMIPGYMKPNHRVFIQSSINAFVGELSEGYLTQLKLEKLGL